MITGEENAELASIISSPRYIQRRQTVPANIRVSSHPENKSLAEALKKIWKECFTRKEQGKKDQKAAVSKGSRSPTDSPRTLTRRMRLRQSSVSEEDILHFAISREDVKAAKNILDHGTVDVNTMRPPGVSALHQACAIGNLQCIKMLLEHGASTEPKTWQGQSALQITARYGHFEAAELLLEHGANMDDIKDGF